MHQIIQMQVKSFQVMFSPNIRMGENVTLTVAGLMVPDELLGVFQKLLVTWGFPQSLPKSPGFFFFYAE